MREELHTFKVEIFDSLDELPEDERELVLTAEDALKSAYAPYSHFRVGAAVSLKTGGFLNIYTGNNQENASFTGSHAERVALDGLARESEKSGLDKIAITSDSPEPVTPCGSCRQDIKEYEDLAGAPITILMAGSRGKVWRVLGIDALLPLAFGPANLCKI